MNGTIAYTAPDRGYGFVDGEDGKRYFFHLSALPKGTFADLRPGNAVDFRPTEGSRGLRAEQMRMVI